jgi:hypothetical protein
VISKNRQGVVTIKSNANLHCYYEAPINKGFNSVQCVVNTGTDGGATWGPGLVVQWPNGMLKVNLRKGGSFGGYYNTIYNLNIGKTQPNKDYPIRIRRTSKSWVGEVRDGRKWHVVIEVPLNIFPYNPASIRIGKTGLLGYSGDYKVAGSQGSCTISNFKLD